MQKDYDNQLYNAYASALAFAADTKTEVQKAAAEARRRVYLKQKEFTKQISQEWREGYALLKKTNDENQAALRQAVKLALTAINDIALDKIEGLQK